MRNIFNFTRSHTFLGFYTWVQHEEYDRLNLGEKQFYLFFISIDKKENRKSVRPEVLLDDTAQSI